MRYSVNKNREAFLNALLFIENGLKNEYGYFMCNLLCDYIVEYGIYLELTHSKECDFFKDFRDWMWERYLEKYVAPEEMVDKNTDLKVFYINGFYAQKDGAWFLVDDPERLTFVKYLIGFVKSGKIC